MRTIIHPWVRFLAALLFLMSGAGDVLAFREITARISALGFNSPPLILACAIIIKMVTGAFLLPGFKGKRAAAA
jgi:uncharacterized membrane protein YphA (DoxX/SURF4 family)